MIVIKPNKLSLISIKRLIRWFELFGFGLMKALGSRAVVVWFYDRRRLVLATVVWFWRRLSGSGDGCLVLVTVVWF